MRCDIREGGELRQSPTAVYLWAVILCSCTTAWALQDQSPAALPKIAILPFECVEGCSDEKILGLGLATDVTHWLVYLPGIVVRPMDAVAQWGGVRNDVERLVRELDIDHCLTGHMRVSATRVHVEAQLRRWPGGTVVISENASAAKKDLADLPYQLAKRIAGALSTRDSMTNGFLKGKGPKSKSYDAFLKALSSSPKSDEEKEQCLRSLETATRHANYPPMVTLLGRLYLDRAGEIGGRGPYYPLAEETLKRAFDLDRDFPLARQLLASLFAKRGRSEETVALMQEGLAQHPTYPGYHMTLGYVLRYGGLMDESIRAYRRAQELDGSLANLVSAQDQITKSFIYKGDYTRALASHHEMLAVLDRASREPNEKQVFYGGVIHLYAGEKAQAIECFQRAAKLDPDSVWSTFGVAYHGIAVGDRARVAEVMDQLERRIVVDGERHYRLAHFCSFLDRTDAALEHLEVSIESGFFNAPYIRQDPLTVSLHGHPRFKELLQTAEVRHLAFRKLLAR